jgi:hypothetical protein
MPSYLKDDGTFGEQKRDSLTDGVIECGSPYMYPMDEQPGKPPKPPLTSRDSRLHSGGNRTGSHSSGSKNMHIPMFEHLDFW